MSVYIDTSAFLAVLARDDMYHEQAKRVWFELLDREERFVCSSYVLVESYALIKKRLGWEALQVFHEAVYPLLDVEWVDAALHEGAANAVLITKRKRLSLVDCTSFAVMRRLGIEIAFTFNPHFHEQGFACLPSA
ncbi:MAG: PIN domain-containing protein [Firmicutes bacterium]|nr:PIN domain-containing protein [Bacillota bacterium]